MKFVKPPTAAGFLVRLPGGAGVGFDAGRPSTLSALGARVELEPLFEVSTGRVQADALAAAAGPGWTWHVARPVAVADAATAWDVAHALQAQVGLATGAPVLIEPDLEQEWPYDNPAVRGGDADRKSTRLNSSHSDLSRMPSSA